LSSTIYFSYSYYSYYYYYYYYYYYHHHYYNLTCHPVNYCTTQDFAVEEHHIPQQPCTIEGDQGVAIAHMLSIIYRKGGREEEEGERGGREDVSVWMERW